MLTISTLPPTLEQYQAEGGHSPLDMPESLPMPIQVELERHAQAVRHACQDYVLAQINKGA